MNRYGSGGAALMQPYWRKFGVGAVWCVVSANRKNFVIAGGFCHNSQKDRH